jgi:hypothetical protein
MNNNCYFEKGGNFCEALKYKECENCSFRKTEKEYHDARAKAEEILERKGLKPFEYSGADGKHISVITR